MKTLKFLLAQLIFDLYLFKKPMKRYTKFDWFLDELYLETFNEYRKIHEKKYKWTIKE